MINVKRDRKNKHKVVAMRKPPSDKAPSFNKLSKMEFHFNGYLYLIWDLMSDTVIHLKCLSKVKMKFISNRYTQYMYVES